MLVVVSLNQHINPDNVHPSSFILPTIHNIHLSHHHHHTLRQHQTLHTLLRRLSTTTVLLLVHTPRSRALEPSAGCESPRFNVESLGGGLSSSRLAAGKLPTIALIATIDDHRGSPMPCDSPSPVATTMTGHGAPSEALPGASDAGWGLDQTFHHPAGLRTARHIVRALLERAERPANIIRGSVVERNSQALPASQASHALFGSNPAVMDDLKEILAFRESRFLDMERSGKEGQTRSSIALGGSRSNTAPGNRNYLPSHPPSLTSTLIATQTPQNQKQPHSGEEVPRGGHPHLDTHFAVESRPPSAGPHLSSRGAERSAQPHLSPSNNQQRSDGPNTELLRKRPTGDADEERDESTASIRSPLHRPHKTSPTPAPKTGSLTSGLPGLGLSTVGASPASRSTPSSTVHHALSPDQASNLASRPGLDFCYTIKGFLPVNKAIETSHLANKQPTPAHSLSSNLQQTLGQERAFTRSNPTDTPAFGKQSGSQPPVQLEIASLSREATTHTHLPSSQSSASSLSSTPHPHFSQTTIDFSLSGDSQTTITTVPRKKMAPKKRKAREDGEQSSKKQKSNKLGAVGTKVIKSELAAKEQLGQDIWMRILEFTPPTFLKKARLINHSFKDMVDKFDSIFVNCRRENYGWDMPPPPPGMTERQYSDLLGGKGCQESGCDDKKATRTYWSWAKRWCSDCWEHRIEREDRILKSRSGIYNRTTLIRMLESIPVAIHDSFVKPHDYIDNVEARSRGPPRLYKCYLTDDLDKIMQEYEALTPPPYKEDPTHTPSQKSAALAAHKALMDALDDKRSEFFAAKKAKNDEHMAKVKRIEVAIRNKRLAERVPRDNARKSRIQLFTRRAREDLPNIPVDFVQKTTSFKAACRIYRDGGTERGWRALKPKIENEWEKSDQNPANGPITDQPASQNSTIGEGGSGIDELEDFEQLHADDMDMNNDRYSFHNSRNHQVLPRPNNFTNMRSGPFVPGNVRSGANPRNGIFGAASSHQSAFSSSALPYPGQTLLNNHASATYVSLFSHMNQSSSSINLAGLPRPNPTSLGALSTHIPVNSLLRPPTPAGGSKCFPSM